MIKPIFIQNGAGGCYRSGFAIDDKGQIYNNIPRGLPTVYKGVKISLPETLDCRVTDAWGVVSMSKEQFEAAVKAAQSQTNTQPQTPLNNVQKMDYQNNYNPALTPVENAAGKLAVGRDENPLGASGTGEIFNISFTNPAGSGAGNQQILLGDGSGVLALRLGVPALSPAIVINGNQGAATLAYYNNMIRAGKWIRLKGQTTFQALIAATGASGNALFSISNTLQFCAQPDVIGAMIQQQPYNFLVNYTGNQLDTSVRHIYDFNVVLADVTALLFTVPEGYTFSMTSTVYSSRTAQTFELANK